MRSNPNIHDGPETRRVIRAGHQEALPVALKGRGFPLTKSSTVHALAFEVMKHLPAFHMLDVARRNGTLRPGQTVVDTSSGTFALGLARVCQIMGHPCLIAADRAISPDLKAAIEHRGAHVEFVDAPVDASNVQELRKRLRAKLARAHHAFVPDQYDNPAHPEAYRAAAEIVCAEIGRIDILVGAVGSGASSRGIGTALREVNPNLRIIAVDTFGSVLFGLPPSSRELRGLGGGLMPANLDHQLYDEVHWVSQDIAIEGTLRVADAGLGDRGLTSGAAWMVATSVATTSNSASVLVVFPDLGWRYREQVSAYRLRRTAVTPTPKEILYLRDAEPPWCCFAWDRRPLQAVFEQDLQEARS
jgi:cysteine synthase